MNPMRWVMYHGWSPANIANYESQMEAAFDLYKSVGVRAVKTGYVADAGDAVRVDANGIRRYEYHDSQFMVGHHLRVVQAAAKR